MNFKKTSYFETEHSYERLEAAIIDCSIGVLPTCSFINIQLTGKNSVFRLVSIPSIKLVLIIHIDSETWRRNLF